MGARVSLFIGLIVVVINTLIGCVVGGISGYFGGKVDMLVMRLIDVLYGIPMIILAILIRTVMDSGVFPLVLAMVALGWIGSARLVRGQVLQLKNQEFVMAARTLGVSDARIILRHMIPQLGGILVTKHDHGHSPGPSSPRHFVLYRHRHSVAQLLVGLAGAGPPSRYNRMQPYQLLIPAFFICTTMLSLNMLGDGLRDALDPRMRR
jgi:oligopeptide transport system permease protein